MKIGTFLSRGLSTLRAVTASILVIAAAISFGAAFSVAQKPPAPAQVADDVVQPEALRSAHVQNIVERAPKGGRNGMRGAGVNGTPIDSVPTFEGQYFAPGYYYDRTGNPIFNNHWYLNTLGKAPQFGGTTTINAPIIPVSLDLRNYDGTPRYVRQVNGTVYDCDPQTESGCQRLYYDATTFTENGRSLLDLVLNSPVFANANYSSSYTPTQFVDAVQRAEFFHNAKSDWHTLLRPAPKTPQQPYVMALIRGSYEFALKADGTCCSLVLVDFVPFLQALFPPTIDLSDTSTVIGRAEHGDITQHDISTFVFPNTYLYGGNPSNCCAIGFHSWDNAIVNNVPRFYVMNFASWISPGGIFPGDLVSDVSPLSHEMAEIFNDPFTVIDNIHNLTQFWLAPNGFCMDVFETGDVIELLPNSLFPMTLNGFVYHPQNEALLQWFSGGSGSIHGALSYPDESVLAGTSGVFNPPLFDTCQATP
jgi:hypothetical protein